MTIDLLFKYGRLNEFSERLFSAAEIYLPSTAQLNDPFECQPRFSFDGPDAAIKEYLRKALRQSKPSLSDTEVRREAERIFLAAGHKDPECLRKFQRRRHTDYSQLIGIYCLSQIQDSILMWTHYADNHRGYCLIFEATNYTPVFGTSLPVIYSNEYPLVSTFTTANDEQIDKIFLTKHIGWAYEKEYRIIDHQNGPGPRLYPAELLKGVIFGLRMLEQDEHRIRGWLSGREYPVDLYKAVQNPHRYAIDIEKLN